MLKKFVQIFGGDPNKREIDRFSDLVEDINALETDFENLSDDQLKEKTIEFRRRLAKGEELDDLLVEAFAAAREASKRTLGLRHYDVQLIGGAALHFGKIAEMRTGEGKTLVATLPLYLNALALNPDWIEKASRLYGDDPDVWEFTPIENSAVGRGVHLVTVNDYLARRDARWMAPIYTALGLSTGVLQMAARTENGKKAFIVDFDHPSPHEDQHYMQMVPRQAAYFADFTYGTNSEFGFDYLRDNMTLRLDDRVQRGHYYAIVDEVDNVLIDEARTPLIISGPAQDEAEWYNRMAEIVRRLRPEDYEISEKDRNVILTEPGEAKVEEALGMPLRDPDRPEDILPEQARMMGYLEQALRAQFLFRKNKDYLVQAGKVIIIDEFTGRLMPGRRWSDGLHQAVEAKEGVKVQSESVTYATITIQNYFRMYEKLSGMTGTAVTEAEEFDKIYKLGVLAIPTNLEFQATRAEAGLEEIESRDEQGYKFRYYAKKGSPEKTPIYWKRKDYPDIVYRTEEAKLRAIAKEILQNNVLGRPMLVGTTSVELSERLSNRLRAEPLKRLCLVLLLRHAWLKKNNREEDGRLIGELQFLNQPLDKLDITEMRKLARDLDVTFNPEDPTNLPALFELLNLPSDRQARLAADLQGGIPHQVLNARKHTEESQIIAGAGAFGAVTIATNMAGRGVDIKLGGELAEEILTIVHRVLNRAGYENIYEMTMAEMQQALLSLPPENYGIYEAEVNYFLKHMEEMQSVRDLGGLHVIGSERHEARRIDNQLRGRSSRQGDPGSSRFFLSMEDELMRLFGGQQADSMMQRLKIDDALPLEVGLVGRLVEQSQTRVEGSNFDIRKHLLEYDDVLNTQRAKIYAQRNRIFTKSDLHDDVAEMVRSEVNRRVPAALKDEGGPWKLLSWLEQIQPSIINGEEIYPSYALRLVADSILQDQDTIDTEQAFLAITQVAEDALQAEHEHQVQTINALLDQMQDRIDEQLAARIDTIDAFFESLEMEEEEVPRRPIDIMTELSSLLHMPVKLSPEGQRALRDDPKMAADEIRGQIENFLVAQSVSRLVIAVERRLEESLEVDSAQLVKNDWNELADQILQSVDNLFENRSKRLIGEKPELDGQVSRELRTALSSLNHSVDRNDLFKLLLVIPQGTRAIFDSKHQRVVQRTVRLTYIYFAAHFLEGLKPEDITEEVLIHLEDAQAALYSAWGLAEWNRLSNTRVADLDERIRLAVQEAWNGSEVAQNPDMLLNQFPPDKYPQIIEALGRLPVTEIYRQLLLNVTTELWVDYLTQMEGLRVSIGLEAYAQRDPLVQYKNKAFGLFQDLLNDMRLAVVSRMFTYRPREIPITQASPIRAANMQSQPSELPSQSDSTDQTGNDGFKDEYTEEEETAESNLVSAESIAKGSQANSSQPSGGKRKRHRRR